MSGPMRGAPVRTVATLLGAALCVATLAAHAEALRYGGTLSDRGAPAEGVYALRLALYDAPQGGRMLGREVTLAGVEVTGGAFSVEADFGVALAPLAAAWLQVEVADAAGRFELLGQRTPAAGKALAADACWGTTGNAGTTPALDFLGTNDAAALEVRVAGERALRLDPYTLSPSVIAGSRHNLATGVRGATIAGGGSAEGADAALSFSGPNIVHDPYGAIGGGVSNSAGLAGGGSTQFAATVAGGQGNQANAAFGSVGGGAVNQVTGYAGHVGGGTTNFASGSSSTVGGGYLNEAKASHSAVAGGESNQAGGTHSAVGGGYSNNAFGAHSFVAGGRLNFAGAASSFAAGTRGYVRGPSDTGTATGDIGTFLWADSQDAAFASGGANQFLIRASGGLGLNRTPASADVELTIEGRPNDAFQGNVDPVLLPSGNGTSDEGMALAVGRGGAGTNDAMFTIAQRNSSAFTPRFRIDADGTTRNTTGAWSTLSDARLKRGIGPITAPLDTLLALRGRTFEYTDAAPGMQDGRRLGFVAQEVREVLPQWVRIGSDGWYSVTPTGFEALAVEAMRELAEENAALQAAHDALEARLARLEARLSRKGR